MKTRKALEQQGWKFYSGRKGDDGRFHWGGMPADAMPPFYEDLKGNGWVPVQGGLMEPPRPGMGEVLRGAVSVVLGIGITVGVISLISKVVTGE